MGTFHMGLFCCLHFYRQLTLLKFLSFHLNGALVCHSDRKQKTRLHLACIPRLVPSSISTYHLQATLGVSKSSLQSKFVGLYEGRLRLQHWGSLKFHLNIDLWTFSVYLFHDFWEIFFWSIWWGYMIIEMLIPPLFLRFRRKKIYEFLVYYKF